MGSDVFTKNEILQTLAKRGYFLDSYTLGTFFQKWKIEAIFEDEQGGEFFDKNALELVLKNLFNDSLELSKKEETQAEPRVLSQIDSATKQKFYEQFLEEERNKEQFEPVQKFEKKEFQQPDYQQFNASHQFPNMQQYVPNMQNQYIPNPQFFQTGMQQNIQQGMMPQFQQFVPNSQFIPQQFQQFMQYQQMPQFQQTQNLNLQEKVDSELRQAEIQNNYKIDLEQDPELDILNTISLSDGTPLVNKVADLPIPEGIDKPREIPKMQVQEEKPKKEEKKMGILAGALEASGQKFEPEEENEQGFEQEQDQLDEIQNQMSSGASSINIENNDTNQEEGDFDDISLLSESFEAQEKFKEYVLNELAKKNVDMTLPPAPSNEFKLDISEKTIGMVARTMAKKIAKHVSSLCAQDTKANEKLLLMQEENKKLEIKTIELEEQNKKLRLLLAESNKNLNSYKPTFFGFYKKVSTDK